MTVPAEAPAPLRLQVDTTLYTAEAVFRSCYLFTDRCYLFLSQADENTISVEFRARESSVDLQGILGLFANELINQRVRADLSKETRTIREMIVARAFGEANPDGSQL